MKILITSLWFVGLLPGNGKTMSRITAELVADYFASPSLAVSTVIFITCSVDDVYLWLRNIPGNDATFYTGRGGINDQCELSTGTLKDTYRRLGVFVDYDCECAKHAVMQVDSYNFTLDVISWLFWSAKTGAKDLDLLPLKLTFYNEVRFALQDGENVRFYDTYRIYSGMSVGSVLVATWNASAGYAWQLLPSKYRRRIDLKNATLQGGFPLLEFNISDPNLFDALTDHNHDKSKDTVARVLYSLWQILREVHNFSLNVTKLTDYGYTKKEDGSYGGLMGILQSGKVDVSLGGLGMIDFRLAIVDFTNTPVWPFRSCFFFLQPRSLDRSTLLIYPFRGVVWLTSILLVVAALGLIKVTASFDRSIKVSFGSALLYISGIFSQQGAVLTSQWAGGRFLLFSSLIFGYILLNYYSGQVVSEILSRSPATITTPRQLLDAPLILAADQIPGFFKLRYKIDRSHLIPEIGVKVERTGGFVSAEAGISKLRGGFYAFETESSKAYSVIDRTYTQAEICTVGEIPMPLVVSYVALKRHSPFKQPFSITVMILNEFGLLKRLRSQWRHPKPQCTGVGATNIIPVDLENASIAFYILFAGAVIACVSFLVENFTWKLALSRDKEEELTSPSRLIVHSYISSEYI